MNVIDAGMLSWRNLQHTMKAENQIPKEQDKLKEACQDFEAIFIKQMLDSMRKTINRTGLIERNMAEAIFEDMLYDEYADHMSKTADFGIAEIMYRQLSQNDTLESGKV